MNEKAKEISPENVQDPPPPTDQELADIKQLAALRDMAAKFAEGIEIRLAESLNSAIEGIRAEVEKSLAVATEVQGKASEAFKALPDLVQGGIEKQLKANLAGITEEINRIFEEKVKAMTGGGNSAGGGGGLNIPYIIDHADKIIEMWNAYKQPTSEQAISAKLSEIYKWHGLLSKIEKGGIPGDDLTKQIAETFTTPK